MSQPESRHFFSIIIPTYNRAEKLRRALESVSLQTYGDFEVIVCDDGSTDHTREVADSYSGKMTVVYDWEENWGGPARPRNNGLKKARGEWVCFLDADDWWYPTKLERVKAKVNSADVIYHDCDGFDSRGKRFLKIRGRRLESPIFVDLMTRWNALYNSTVCVRKSILDKAGGFSEEKDLVAIEDFDLWLRLSMITERFCYIPELLGAYWIDAESISAFTDKSIERETAIHRKYAHYLSAEDRGEAEKILSYRIGLINWEIGKKNESRQMFLRSLKARKLRTRYFSLLRIVALMFLLPLSRTRCSLNS